MVAARILAMLVAMFPHSPRNECLTRRADTIASQANAAAEAHGIPVGLLLIVGYFESHLGCDPHSGGNWGAPVSRDRRGVAGTPDHAASALALGFARCHTWVSGVHHFRNGRCSGGPLVGYAPFEVMRLFHRVSVRIARQ